MREARYVVIIMAVLVGLAILTRGFGKADRIEQAIEESANQNTEPALRIRVESTHRTAWSIDTGGYLELDPEPGSIWLLLDCKVRNLGTRVFNVNDYYFYVTVDSVVYYASWSDLEGYGGMAIPVHESDEIELGFEVPPDVLERGYTLDCYQYHPRADPIWWVNLSDSTSSDI